MKRTPGALRAHVIRAAVIATAVWYVAACESVVQPRDPSSQAAVAATSAPFVVSGPVAKSAASGLRADLAAETAPALVFVSLPPNAIPAGVSARITVERTGASVETPVVDGGFDPVGVSATTGDTLEVIVQTSTSTVPLSVRFTVPQPQPPIIVRTEPPPHKRDVPLNERVIVVFSEPIDERTRTSAAFQLRHDADIIDGDLSFADSAHTAVRFTPAARLIGATNYTFEVTPVIRDLNGVAFQAPAAIDFTTVAAPAGGSTVASIDVTPASGSVPIYTTLQLTATTRDVGGNDVTDRPVVWTSSNNNVAGVSPRGLVAGITPGVATITAFCDGLAASATITVAPNSVALVVLAPNSSTIKIANDSTGQVKMTATPYDAQGAVVTGRIPIWLSSDDAIATVTGTGIVRGVSPGTVTITAMVTGVPGRATVVVDGVPAASVTVAPNPLTINPGYSLRLSAVVKDAGGTTLANRPIRWSSSAPNVATVSSDGLVEGRSVGTTTVTATSGPASGSATVNVVQNVVTSVSVSPASATVEESRSLQLSVTVKNAQGVAVTNRPIAWAASNPGVVSVNSNGLVTGVGAGNANVTATVDGVVGTAHITVKSNVVASVDVSPNAATVVVGAPLTLVATPRNAAGDTLTGHPIAWTSGNPGVATVTNAGIVSGVALGTATIIATIDGVTGSAQLTVNEPTSITTVVTGSGHACALTTSGATLCWGDNSSGQLGDGTLVERHLPTRGVGGFAFASLAAGGSTTCGLTAGGTAYCWGYNGEFELGDGTNENRATPAPVSSGLTFASLTVGAMHSCGLTFDGKAYCWGHNGDGQLGDGTLISRYAPVPVAGGLTFASLTAGGSHTCGVTAGGTAYCWGANYSGQIGDGTFVGKRAPVPVAGVTFAKVASGAYHTCGLATSGVVYCWGSNDAGALGYGGYNDRPQPTQVADLRTYSALSVGSYETCAISGSVTFCWGVNYRGELGNGTYEWDNVPTPVAGGLVFSTLNLGGEFACGITVTGAVYCWGYNGQGQLGDGTYADRLVPTLLPMLRRGQ